MYEIIVKCLQTSLAFTVISLLFFNMTDCDSSPELFKKVSTGIVAASALMFLMSVIALVLFSVWS